jgi:hypothetical protein
VELVAESARPASLLDVDVAFVVEARDVVAAVEDEVPPASVFFELDALLEVVEREASAPLAPPSAHGAAEEPPELEQPASKPAAMPQAPLHAAARFMAGSRASLGTDGKPTGSRLLCRARLGGGWSRAQDPFASPGDPHSASGGGP